MPNYRVKFYRVEAVPVWVRAEDSDKAIEAALAIYEAEDLGFHTDRWEAVPEFDISPSVDDARGLPLMPPAINRIPWRPS